MVGISTSGIDKAIDDISMRIDNVSNNTVYDLADFGANQAASIVPQDTGRLKSHIRSEKTGAMSARVLSRNPAVYNHGGFSLPVWLHATAAEVDSPYEGTQAGYMGSVMSPQQHINSGVANYMDVAYFMILNRIDEEFDQEFNQQF